MDIFDLVRDKEKESPLAARLRPTNLSEFVGQQHVLGENTLLSRAIKADRLSSIILHGPPGVGKTTIAKIISHTTKSKFETVNATTAGVKDLKEIIEGAKKTLSGKKTILFIDEIHRFNKSQQDLLLPYVEDATITLIGATTENPYFEVNKALISRSLVFALEPLSEENIKQIVLKAINDTEKGLGIYNVEITKEALEFLSGIANGDARVALNAIELATLTTEPTDGKIIVDTEIIKECVQKRAVGYDKSGEMHYNTISAFIKSMRGSDADAAVYYLARMLYAGEDPKFIARRMVIFASEDVGNADPQALVVAVSAAQAVEFIGMPEGRIILSQAVTYLANAKKCNRSYLAIDRAMRDVQDIRIKDIPSHLKDSAVGYKYPHSYPDAYVEQQYLPDELVGKKYF